jgi:hypothetical protein
MRAMWKAGTVCAAGFVLVLASCSSSNSGDTPPAGSGANGSGAGPSTGDTGSGAQSGNGSGAQAGNGSGAQSGNGTGAQSGNGAGGGSSGNTGGTSTGNTGGTSTSNTGGATASATGGAGGACAAESAQATATPPVLEFVIDVTGSMGQDAYPQDPNNNATKLAELKRILPPVFAGFPTDWAVGIEFFNFAGGGGRCYQGTQAVQIAPLSTNLTQINQAIAGVQANNYTPTYAAWKYGVDQVRLYNNPTYATSDRSVVLITDGVPTVTNDGCTIQNPVTQATYDALINMVTTNGVGGTPPIKTYVIGVLGSQDPQGATYDPMYQLSLVAVAGGTAPAGCTPQSGVPSGANVNPRGTYCHYDLTSNPDFAAGLQQALAAIGRGQITCSFTVPAAPSDGRIFDLQDIHISYTPSGGTARDLAKAPDQSCVGGQWYVSGLDASGNPAQLQLCPDTCAAAQGDPGSQVSVTFTCLSRQ